MLTGTSGVIWSNHPSPLQPPRTGCQRLHSEGFWWILKREALQPLQQICANFRLSKEVLPVVQMELLVFLFVPIASCPDMASLKRVWVHLCTLPSGCIYFIYRYWWDPSETPPGWTVKALSLSHMRDVPAHHLRSPVLNSLPYVSFSLYWEAHTSGPGVAPPE